MSLPRNVPASRPSALDGADPRPDGSCVPIEPVSCYAPQAFHPGCAMLRLPLLLALILSSLPALAAKADKAPADADKASEAPAPVPAPDAEAVDDGGAFQRIEERAPRAGTPLIANKLYPMQFRLEVGVYFNMSYADKYVEHRGASGSLGFHIFDWLAIEGFGGYMFGEFADGQYQAVAETGIVDHVRAEGKSAGLVSDPSRCANPNCEPQLPDLWATTWFAGANVQWAPIYGKLSAVSEYDLNFQLYARLGGGVEGVQKKLNTLGFSEPQLRPSGNYGIGLRLIPWKHIAVRAELVNYIGKNPNVEEHDPNDEGECQDGYVLVGADGKNCQTDFSSIATFQVGVSFLF